MSTLNVKIPDGMEADLESFLEENPQYLNKSELVRDALRHVLASGKNSVPATGAPSEDDPLFSAPAVTVDDPVGADEIDDVVYGKTDE